MNHEECSRWPLAPLDIGIVDIGTRDATSKDIVALSGLWTLLLSFPSVLAYWTIQVSNAYTVNWERVSGKLSDYSNEAIYLGPSTEAISRFLD